MIITWTALASGLTLFIALNHPGPTRYFMLFRNGFGLNAMIGLIFTIILFSVLFISSARKKVRLNFLIYGFIANILFLTLSFTQASMNNRFSHIPYPAALGASLFLIFMTVAIADKINLYRREKEEAQENALRDLERIVEERTHDLQQQKKMVEVKNKEITDSMVYAKRLQYAILPPLSLIRRSFGDSFVFYRPKDIVAGDFYWMESVKTLETGELTLIAVADCTGHGVPGAMVSVVCSDALNRTVKEFKITDPGKILDKTRELVLERFSKSESEVKDGMDISLLLVDRDKKEASWSGANNPLWYIYKNELKEIKADKQPIGKTDYAKPFTTHKIEYKEGTSFYLFSDGFADQFGGPKGKKFKYKQLKEMLLSHTNLSLKKQEEIIEDKFDKWKGELEQVDDVCLIGIRL
jgi:serine phosphatase RsbU (regulator of sigma subunit)